MNQHVTHTAGAIERIAPVLLLLRIGVFVVMLFWTLDKFVNPAHAGKVYEHFYGLGGLGEAAFLLLGVLELLLVLAFVAGFARRFSYGLVLLFHAVSTLSSWQQYLDPFSNLLFFAAWPMLAACIALYALRDLDVMLSVDHWRSARPR